jgi:DNA-binding transcriptional LysR family regulator
MEIQQLRGFHAVAKYKNFTVAAQKTQRTQPTISLQVKALEDELGVKLFERLGPRRVTVTPEGKILLELTAPILQDVDSLETRFREALGNYSSSRVAVATHTSVMVYLLPPIIQKFKAAYPTCHLAILNRNRDEMIKMLEGGEIEFGITSISNPPSTIDYRVFSRFNRILIATRDHPISKLKKVGIADIAKYPLILPAQDSTTRRLIDNLFQQHGLKPQVAVEVVGRTAIKTYVSMDLGLSIINEYYLTKQDREQLFVADVTEYFGQAETGIVLRKGRLLPKPAKDLIEFVIETGRL